jgi:hypothetical protein
MSIQQLCLLASLAVATMLASSCTKPKSQVPSKPQLTIVGGDTVNWGRVAPGTLTKQVTISNTGGDTLRIDNVRPSCGCTTAPLTHKVLPPGDTATINVSIDMRNHGAGPVMKTMTITSNDSSRSSVVVMLKADLFVDVSAEPNYFPPAQEVKVNKEFDTALQIKNSSDAPVTIQPPVATDNNTAIIRFDMKEPKQLQPGESEKIIAHVTPKQTGSINNIVLIKTSSKTTPQLTLPIYYNAQQ